jgi:hypothetical protein
VRVSRSPTDHDGEFAQLQVSRGDRTTQLDLARDWRACELVTLEVGPVLHLKDAVGAKVTAMLGRGLPRDYLDIGAALDRFGPAGCSSWASSVTRDCGSRTSQYRCSAWTGSAT